jgi:uncharacterized protein (UPF0264 family)
MTRLLVSVTDAAEALVARDHGANLIDVKDPSQGSLGAKSPAVWREVIAAVGKTVPVSAALGELNDARVDELAQQTAGLAFAKIGLQGSLPGEEWRAKWMRWRSYLPMRVKPVMVVYADWRECGAPHPQHQLDVVKQIRIPAVLVDTFDKQGGTLRDHCSDEQLIRFCAAARKRKSIVVLAGSLQLRDLPAILPLAPDYVAVRGAVCRESRTGPIVGALVREWSQALSAARR